MTVDETSGDARLDAVKRATAGNIDQKGGGYCYGCPHALDAEAFLADLRDEGFVVMPLEALARPGGPGSTGSVAEGPSSKTTGKADR